MSLYAIAKNAPEDHACENVLRSCPKALVPSGTDEKNSKRAGTAIATIDSEYRMAPDTAFGGM